MTFRLVFEAKGAAAIDVAVFEARGAARTAVAARLRAARRFGRPVATIDRGASWIIAKPDAAGDDVDVLTLTYVAREQHDDEDLYAPRFCRHGINEIDCDTCESIKQDAAHETALLDAADEIENGDDDEED